MNNKNKFLIVASLFLVLIVYEVAVSKTLYYYNSFKLLNEQLVDVENKKKALVFLNEKNKNLDIILKNNASQNPSINYQNYLLKIISSLSETNALKIVNFEEPQVFSVDHEEITHYKFSVEGNFNNAIIFLNQLENSSSVGKIIHFSTEKKMIYKENSIRIISTIVIEK